jgi:hypothetical protein
LIVFFNKECYFKEEAKDDCGNTLYIRYNIPTQVNWDDSPFTSVLPKNNLLLHYATQDDALIGDEMFETLNEIGDDRRIVNISIK